MMQDTRLAESAIREQEKQIRYTIKPFRIADLVNKYNKGQFYIPDYQRDEVWNYSMKSKFIESVLLGLPIPDIFVCQTKDHHEDYDQLAKFEVIDGSQRLRTLVGFIEGKFHLKNMEVIEQLNGFYYNDLTDSRKDKFNDVTIDVIILDSETSEEVKNAMFDRINTSNPLKTMELRRGIYTGLFNDLVRECGNLLKTDYQSICQVSRFFKDRREEEELVLRFFAFSETLRDNLSFQNLEGEKFSQHNESNDDFLTAFYDYQNRRFKQLKEKDSQGFEKEINRLQTNFTTMLKFVEKKFPNGFKREKSKSVARVVFEAISVGVHLALEENPEIMAQNHDTNWVKNDKAFKEAINQKYGLHEPNKILQRIEIVKNKLLGR